jgi:lipopolysaccharide transport system ATP-binding protein
MNNAIQVSNISKRYRIGLKEETNDTFAAALLEFMKGPFKNFRKYRSLYRFKDIGSNIDFDVQEKEFEDIIWALKDISFDVPTGEALGVIGSNGAGKSTLLKVLSRITHPTMGQVLIKGRVSSLLEVGTGFHPELTGRDNVFLNATILGMKKKEVVKKFDQIVEFSGVERFIDTPVKRYSSGMKVRLAFSVAAHLEPEILIVDEVLAVGDANFQTKCLTKMENLGQEGRTVIFVTHNMPAVTRLCTRAIMIENGRVVNDGSPRQVVSDYLNSNLGTSAAREWDDVSNSPGNDVAKLRAVRARNERGEVAESFDIQKPIDIEIEFDVHESGHLLLPHFNLINDRGQCAFISVDLDPQWRKRPRPTGKYISSARIPGNLLSEGTTYICVFCMTLNPDRKLFSVRNAIGFNVIDSLNENTARGDYKKDIGGVVRPKLDWKTEFTPD